MKSPEEVLFGSGCQTVNLSRMAPAVGCGATTLKDWKAGRFPESFRVLANICMIRDLSDAEIGALIRSFRR